MHEFTTDIVRMQVLPNETGQLLSSSAATLQTKLTVLRTAGDVIIGIASVVLSVRHSLQPLLSYDQSEIGITFHPSTSVIGGKELILYDTAPGGAGYAIRAVQSIREVFETAEKIVASCDCGDSCYSCLRSYNNQMFHQRLNQHYIPEGLQRFNRRNWSTGERLFDTASIASS